MLYLVTHALKNGKRTALEEELKKSRLWWHHIDSTWIVETDDAKASEFYDRLNGRVPFESGDRLLIIEIDPKASRQGWLPREAWEWLRARRAAIT